ncbi:alginate export family protein [Aquirufa sp. OSTEICH-129V]|uniref:Alginate export family protein n=1 Tax=Aquirufa avitistagni TaxID=3104728 RepID=A0ABW6DCA3_9BACT
MLRIVLPSLLVCLLSFHVSAQHIARLRFDDDFSYLKSDSSSKSWDEKVKFLPIVGQATLSIGGEIREHYQNYTNVNFGQIPASYVTGNPHQWLHRILLHGDLQLHSNFRVFAQINNTIRFWNPNPITNQVDQNTLSFHQWFADLKLADKLVLRLGRQELLFGQERFIAAREGPNNRQSFLGAHVIHQAKRIRTDLFYTHPIRLNQGAFDDEKSTEKLAGLHVKYDRVLKFLNADAFYYYFESKAREYYSSIGVENRHTLGVHLYSNPQRFNYDFEFSRQMGTFKSLDIRAMMAVWDVNLAVMPHRFIGFSGNYVPGDQSTQDGQLNTFNTMFARPPFGQTVALNISNTLNLSPYIRYQNGTKWIATARASFVQRTSAYDGVYTPNMSQLRPYDPEKMTSDALKLCDIYAVDVNYVPTKHYFFQAELGYCKAGTYLKETGAGQNVIYFAVRNAIKF